MNRAYEKRAFLVYDYRGGDLLVLKRVIMRYKTTDCHTRENGWRLREEGDPDSLFLLRRMHIRTYVPSRRTVAIIREMWRSFFFLLLSFSNII